MSRRATARGHPGRRLHLGLGRSVLHAPARAPRSRGDPRRDRDPHLRHAPAPAVRGVQARPEPQRLLQPVQPGEEEPRARPEAARGARGGEAPVRRERHRRRELRRRRDGPHGSRLRRAARAAPGRHHDRALGIRRHRPRPRQGVVRAGAGAALGLLVGDRLSRPSADARRASRTAIRRAGCTAPSRSWPPCSTAPGPAAASTSTSRNGRPRWRSCPRRSSSTR